MDPSQAEVKDGGAMLLSLLRMGVGKDFKGRVMSRVGRGKWGAHPAAGAAHLYCIGDGTLIRKLVEKAARLLLE
jgi:hypothetical protein